MKIHVYITPDGERWSEHEYLKHHQEEHPDAVFFILAIPSQHTYEAGEAYLSALTKLIAAELE